VGYCKPLLGLCAQSVSLLAASVGIAQFCGLRLRCDELGLECLELCPVNSACGQQLGLFEFSLGSI
jgi:hypothetical protein